MGNLRAGSGRWKWRIAALALILGCAGERSGGSRDEPPRFDPGPAPPELADGARAFEAFCSGCHGRAGTGFAGGPPLLDTLYLPERFSDAGFRRAIAAGAPARHWSFGAMPPVRAIPPDRIPAVVAYVRWAQERWVARRASAVGDSTAGTGAE